MLGAADRTASARCSSCASACAARSPARWRRSASASGVTRERIRQIEAKTLTKLQAYRDTQRLREFLD